MSYLDSTRLLTGTRPGRQQGDRSAGSGGLTDRTLWRITAEGSDPSGGGAWTYYVATRDPAKLPEVDPAYRALRGRDPDECSIYAVECIERVDRPTPETDSGNVLDDGVYDERSGLVVPFDRWRA